MRSLAQDPVPVVARAEASTELFESQEWQLVRRIQASPGFSKSLFLSNFLGYICDRKLRGREEEITEQQIGIHAFQRSGGYNPGEDNIVRNYARTLRTRLDVYFANEGKDESIRINVPRGHYVPVFIENQLQGIVQDPNEDHPHPQQTAVVPSINGSNTVSRRKLPSGLLFLGGGLAICVLLLGYRALSNRPASLVPAFWNSLLPDEGGTYVVVSDTGFELLQDLTGRQVHLHEYISNDMDRSFSDVGSRLRNVDRPFRTDRFDHLTSTADLSALADLARLPEFSKAKARVRYARDIRLDDLRHGNSIIVGGPHANPWIELYEPMSDFRIEVTSQLEAPQLDKRVIVNKHPRAGEKATYTNVGPEDEHVTFAILSYLPNIDRVGHTLLLEGTSMPATEAAADFATNPTAMNPILTKAKRRDGSFGSFEILLETRVLGASGPQAHVVAEHYTAQP